MCGSSKVQLRVLDSRGMSKDRSNPLPSSRTKDIIRRLFEYYSKHPDKLPADFIPQLDFDGMERIVCDYIAGMTDKYAIYKYSEIFIPTAWQVR